MKKICLLMCLILACMGSAVVAEDGGTQNPQPTLAPRRVSTALQADDIQPVEETHGAWTGAWTPLATCARFLQSGKWGLLDGAGRVIIDARYDVIFAIDGVPVLYDDATGLAWRYDGQTLEQIDLSAAMAPGDAFRYGHRGFWTSDGQGGLAFALRGADDGATDGPYGRATLICQAMDERVYGATTVRAPSGGWSLALDGEDAPQTPWQADGEEWVLDGVHTLALSNGAQWWYFDDDAEPITTIGALPAWESAAAGVEWMQRATQGRPLPYPPTEGVIALNTSRGCGYVTLDGRFITRFDYQAVRPALGGMGWVLGEGQWTQIPVNASMPERTPEATLAPTSAPTAAPTATPAPTPAQSGGYVVMKPGTQSNNIRSKPDRFSDIVGRIYYGDRAEFLGQTEADERGIIWYYCRFGSVTGWISSRYTLLVR